MEIPDLLERSANLAIRIETMCEGEEGYTVISACCWVVADLIMQAERMKGRAAEESLTLVMQQVLLNVSRLRTVAMEEVRH